MKKVINLQRRERCENCKYFYRRNNCYAVIEDEEGKDYGMCKCSKFQYLKPVQGETDNLVYSDSEGYSAGFDVGINFCCIHFEPKGEI